VNRKVLSLEAAARLRVSETDHSRVVHPTEPSQFAASIGRPASALVIGFMVGRYCDITEWMNLPEWDDWKYRRVMVVLVLCDRS
jgi:hypothetical protein